MGLNDIELTPAALASLYGSLLVESATDVFRQPEPSQKTDPVPDEKEEPKWKHLGNNEKQILVAVHYKDSPIIPDTALNLLTNMLNACKLSLADVAIINFNSYQETGSKEILANFKSKQVLLFGIEPADFGLPVSFPVFQVQRVANTTFLYSPTLEEIANDKLIKSKLWVSLQHFFTL